MAAARYFCLLHADGFALYRTHGNDEKKRIEISELAAVTPQAHIALWRVLLGMDLIETVTVWTHPDDVLPYLLTDPRLVRTVGVEDTLWLRMLDIPAVLEARSYAADVSVVLDISDDVLGGGGRYALDVQRRQGAVCPDRRRRRCAHRSVSARQPVHGWPPCLGVRIRTSPAVQRLWTGGSAGRGVRHRRAS